MYIFGYKTTVFVQNLYILVKFFGKNFIFSVKSTNLFFSGPNVDFWVQNYSFYPKFVHFGKMFWQKFIFRVKSTIFLCFFGTKCTFLGTKLHFLSKICTFWSSVWAKTSFLE